jgi:hypothetical protein
MRFFERITLESLEDPTPNVGSAWINPNSDRLNILDNSWVWSVRIENISLLLNEIVETFNFEEPNNWELENKWKHKNQIPSIAGKQQAQIPIIEYENYLELSDTASVRYKWRYSPDGDIYSKVEKQPTLFELQPIVLDDSSIRMNSIIFQMMQL